MNCAYLKLASLNDLWLPLQYAPTLLFCSIGEKVESGGGQPEEDDRLEANFHATAVFASGRSGAARGTLDSAPRGERT